MKYPETMSSLAGRCLSAVFVLFEITTKYAALISSGLAEWLALKVREQERRARIGILAPQETRAEEWQSRSNPFFSFNL